MNQVLLNNRSVVGIDWGAWAMRNGDDQRALLGEVLDAVADGRSTPRRPPSARWPRPARSSATSWTAASAARSSSPPT